MSEYKVDKRVPLPNSVKRNQYPFGEMEVGHSFMFDPAEYLKVASAGSYYGKRNNKKFSIRNLRDGTYRCWRVA
jgi:hypothetical protein